MNNYNNDYALLDACLARSREGLRVLDEVARFVLRNEELFSKIKVMRHVLQNLELMFGPAQILEARRKTDLGEQKKVGGEQERRNLFNIVRANVNRITESLRVLEEFSKIYLPAKTILIEGMRYDIYRIEREILIKTPHYWLNKYFEEGIVYPISNSVQELVWLIEHGAKVIQLRDKTSLRSEIYKKAKFLCNFIKKFEQKNKIYSVTAPSPLSRLGGTPPFGQGGTAIVAPAPPLERGGNREPVLLILNNDVELAARLPVAGVHVGQTDYALERARKVVGANKIIGCSNNDILQLRESAKRGADYLSVGPVFATPQKPEKIAVGLGAVSQAAAEINIPWLAIGGINKSNIEGVRLAGAKNFAMIRGAKEFF